MRSVHDNNVYSYVVDCRKKCIVLHTEYVDGTTQEFGDVVFDGVVAHRFEHQLPGNILFDIQEMDVAPLIRGETELFDHGRRYGWPQLESSTNDELIAVLLHNGIKAYEIAASYGLSGWVLAQSMRIVERKSAADTTGGKAFGHDE